MNHSRQLLVVDMLLFVILASYGQEVDSTYHNPLFVNKEFDIGDVNVFDGEDGYYYLYGSGRFANQVLYRSKNFVDWENTEIVPIPESTRKEIIQVKQPSKEDVENIFELPEYI